MDFWLRIILLLLGVQGINSVWTVSKITAQSGGSVSIPCHYHHLHKDLPKLWCKGKSWLTCIILRPTNQVRRTGISFYNSPDELVTTMTMTNLRSSDSDRYWCAVRTRGSYVRTSLDLSVTEDTPDLSVSSNRVSGEEGGNVTVKCLYSDKLRDAEKKWCISGDLRSCQTAEDIEASPSAALQMNDTNAGVYTVTLTGLKGTDAGWYWCMAGGVQAPVHVSVDSGQHFTEADTSINSLWTVSKITAQSGGSVSIPCHYHRLHKDLPKLWCKGKSWLTCIILRPTNQSRRTGISFYNSPDELVTTITMTDLRSNDSNRYWCAVRTRGFYVRTSLDLSVTEATPDLSVSSNRVSGEEGGNVTVKCLYSDKLRDAEKKWCISGDLRSCQTAEDIEASPGAALQMNDTNAGVYTVTLTGLKATDAGWYWCMAGGVQAPVHVSVDSGQLYTEADTSSSTFTTAPSFTSVNSFNIRNHNSVATLVPTKPKLPEHTEKPDQTSITSKQFPSTVQSFSTTKGVDSSQISGTIRTPLTSRSATLYIGSSFTVPVSTKELIFEPTPTYETRDFIWLIPLVCGALIIFMLFGISWKLWSWHKKANTREEATELTTDFNVNESGDLLGNDWTNA